MFLVVCFPGPTVAEEWDPGSNNPRSPKMAGATTLAMWVPLTCKQQMGGEEALSVAFDGKIFIRNQWIQSFVSPWTAGSFAGGVGSSRPPLRSFHAKGWSKCSPHRGFPQKNSIPTAPLWWFCRVTPAACPFPPLRSLALVRRAVHALVEGRKAGKSPYQNQGVWEKVSHLSDGFCCLTSLLALCKCLQSFWPFWTILTFLLFHHANIEHKNRSTQISIHKVYLFFQKNIPLPNFALPIHSPVWPLRWTLAAWKTPVVAHHCWTVFLRKKKVPEEPHVIQ